MEKNKPHCPLERVKELTAKGAVEFTFSAVQAAYSLGFMHGETVAEIMALKKDEFYKSMTTYNRHDVWQDVYRHASKAGMLYIKITVTDNVLVVSFKEL